MITKRYTADEYRSAILKKENEIRVLRTAMEAAEEAERIMSAMETHKPLKLFEHPDGTPVEQDVRTRPFSEGSEVAGLSAVHGRLLLLVASMDPAPTNAIYSYLPRGYYGDVDEKNRRPRLSKWLNEMKAKGVIVPDPHNGISRKDFKWNITTKGRSMIR